MLFHGHDVLPVTPVGSYLLGSLLFETFLADRAALWTSKIRYRLMVETDCFEHHTASLSDGPRLFDVASR